MHQPIDHEICYVIDRNKDDQTAILECTMCKVNGHLVCRSNDGRVETVNIDKCLTSQAFETREEAQKAYDDLQTYIAYRQSSHRMK